MSDCSNIYEEFINKNSLQGINTNSVVYALTHTSYSKDNNLPYSECYERLEFLGDAVLKLVVSDILYKKFPDYKEGEMTKIRASLVSDEFILNFANDIEIGKYIRISSSLEKDGGRNTPSILSCAFEALLGAMFESGMEYSKIYNFINKFFEKYFPELEHQLPKFNSKGILQEYTQSVNQTLPIYITKTVPEGFYTQIVFESVTIGEGTAKSKRESEREAAYSACQKLKLIGD